MELNPAPEMNPQGPPAENPEENTPGLFGSKSQELEYKLPEGKTYQEIQVLTRIIRVLGVVLALTVPYLIYLGNSLQTYQAYLQAAGTLVFTIVSFYAATLPGKGRAERATWIMIVGISGMALLSAFNFDSMGLALVLPAVGTNWLLARQGLSKQSFPRALGFILASGALVVLLDLLPLPTQSTFSNEIGQFIPIIAGLSFAAIIAINAGVFLDWFTNQQVAGRIALTITLLLVGSLASVTVTAVQNVRDTLTVTIGEAFTAETQTLSELMGSFFLTKVGEIQGLTLSDLIKDELEIRNAGYTGGEASTLREIQTLDAQWVSATGLDSLVRTITSDNRQINPTNHQLLDYIENFPDHAEIFITDRYGANLAATSRTSDYYQADEDWWQAAWNGGRGAVYISNPGYDESTGVTGVQIAMPIYAGDTGQVIGIVRSTLVVDQLFEQIGVRSGEGKQVILFSRDGGVIFEGEAEESAAELPLDTRLQLIGVDAEYILAADAEGDESIFGHSPVIVAGTGEQVVGGESNFNEIAISEAVEALGWAVVIREELSSAYEPVDALTRSIIIVGVIAAVVSLVVGVLITGALTRPLATLTVAAEEFGRGNLSARADVHSTDEIGTLAKAYNQMAEELQSVLEGLEGKVAERTRMMETSAEVSRRLSTILDQQQLAVEVVNQVQEAFGYYHTHIYLFDRVGENLVMAGGTGEAGRQMLESGHTIPKGSGLVGRAAADNLAVLVPDVSQETGWLPNPLLPETAAEIAVPIAAGDRVLGVLDVQHNLTGGLGKEDTDLLESIASQVAIALQNIRQFVGAQDNARRQAQINEILQRIQSTNSVEAALRIAVREVGRALDAEEASVKLS